MISIHLGGQTCQIVVLLLDIFVVGDDGAKNDFDDHYDNNEWWDALQLLAFSWNSLEFDAKTCLFNIQHFDIDFDDNNCDDDGDCDDNDFTENSSLDTKPCLEIIIYAILIMKMMMAMIISVTRRSRSDSRQSLTE